MSDVNRNPDDQQNDDLQNGDQGQGHGGQDDQIRNLEKYQQSQEAARYRNERNALQTQMEQVSTELEELRQFKQEQDNKNKTEKELAEQKIAEQEKTIETQQSTIVEQNLKLSILTHGDAGKFHSPIAALKFVADYNPEIDKDGNVTNMGDILEAIAKDHAYLLKDVSDDGDKKNNDSSDKDGGPASGSSSGAPFNGKKKDGTPDRAYLEEKFPALRGR